MVRRGQPRLPVGHHGTISTRTVGPGRVRATTHVRDPDGRRRQVTATAGSKTAARAALLDRLGARAGFGRLDLTADSTLSQVADRWLGDLVAAVAAGTRAPNTARVYRTHLDRHVRPAVGELLVREATVSRLDTMLTEVRARHGPALTRTVRTVLNGVMGWAVRHGLVERNPMREVAPIVGGGRSRPVARALTDTERDAWLAAMDGDEAAVHHDLPDLTRIMLGTGCRIAETLALDWADVDTAGKQVWVRWQVVRLEGGGGLVRTPTKTAAGDRRLDLPGWVVDVLISRWETAGQPAVGPVLVSRVGGLRDPSNVSRSLREARERAGFGWVTSHVFRRTVATVLHDSGLAPRQIADQLGHASLRTLEAYIGRGSVGRDAAVALEATWTC